MLLCISLEQLEIVSGGSLVSRRKCANFKEALIKDLLGFSGGRTLFKGFPPRISRCTEHGIGNAKEHVDRSRSTCSFFGVLYEPKKRRDRASWPLMRAPKPRRNESFLFFALLVITFFKAISAPLDIVHHFSRGASRPGAGAGKTDAKKAHKKKKYHPTHNFPP